MRKKNQINLTQGEIAIEDKQIINDVLLNAKWLMPFLNDLIGQKQPDSAHLKAGLLAYADGTNWNPGSGVGYYYYNGSAWVYIGDANQFKIGSFTIDMTTATGTQAVTGVGFIPRILIFLSAKSSGVDYSGSVGFDNGTSKFCIATYLYSGVYTAWTNSAAASILYPSTPGVVQYAGFAQSLDADGFTISWTRTGAPTGTLTVYYLAVR